MSDDRQRPLRLALVGGGPGAFIGPVHRVAAELDREFSLMAGAFSSDPARSREAGRMYGIDASRAYPSVQAMIAAERTHAEPVDVIAIATPNHLHLPAARVALEAGFAVISDKPATATLAEALELQEIVARTGGAYALTYTYTGYPMVREARARVAAGAIGRVRKVVVEYFQGWLAKPIERKGHKQAAWRVDPERSGLGGCIGDIGVHAFNLAEFVSGDRVCAINPQLYAIVDGRKIDDDCTILTRFAGGGSGIVAASQIAVGERNGLTLRLYGETGGLRWRQEAPDRLELLASDGTMTTLWGGTAAIGADGQSASRLPGGHPEGYFEAFANLYCDMARKVRGDATPLLPTIEDGVRSMAFVEASIRGNGLGWADFAA